MRIISVIMYIGAMVFIGLGFHKLLVYENPDSYLRDSVNAYVGGDAYNFIINGTHATAYFVLATLFAIVGSTMLIVHTLRQDYENKDVENSNNNNYEEVV